MTMAVPLAGLNMNLDIPANYFVADGKNSVLKITATGLASSARVDCLKWLTAIGNQVDY
jgi:hypothetical protein